MPRAWRRLHLHVHAMRLRLVGVRVAPVTFSRCAPRTDTAVAGRNQGAQRAEDAGGMSAFVSMTLRGFADRGEQFVRHLVACHMHGRSVCPRCPFEDGADFGGNIGGHMVGVGIE